MIKVIIERRVAPGLEGYYQQIIGNLLDQIKTAPGYLGGESLEDANAPNHFIVIAKWRSVDAWEKWYHSRDRKRIITEISPLLEQPERFTILKQSVMQFQALKSA